MRVLTRLVAMVLAIAAAVAPASSYSHTLRVYKQLTETANLPLYTTMIVLNRDSVIPYTTMTQQQTVILDLDAPLTLHYAYPRQDSCQGCPKGVRCDESPCTVLRTSFSYQNPSCPPHTNASMYGDAFNDCELCPVNVINPVSRSCIQAIPAYDEITLNSREVSSSSYTTYPITGLVGDDEFRLYPMGVRGVLALSSSPYAVPASYDINKMALCLPNRDDDPLRPGFDSYGVLTLGDGPYSIDVDITSFLSYTTLIKQPNSYGYFIGVNDIVIKNRSTSVPANTTVKISTIEQYMKLRTDVYNGVVRRFLKVTKRIPQAKAVAPFGVCFNTTVNGTNVGIKVPNIDLVLQGGKKWTISTANSITQVADGVACLAVVDGGATAEHAIVIGTYQLEDNFLLFDLEKSSLGFYPLLHRGSRCSDFRAE